MAKIFFDKVTIIGVGLIGASLALALKKNRLCNYIIGCGRTENNLREAKIRKIIDLFKLDLNEACADSDLIVFSSPVGSFKNIAKKIRGSLKSGAIVTDVGSVKGNIVKEVESFMPDGIYFVGAHPIAGSEKTGIDNASADLFLGARCILTPTEKTDNTSFRKIACLWEKIGASVTVMSPTEHDIVYGAVSHFPHVVAYTIMNTVGGINKSYLKFAGRGFKDTTRIASSSPVLWRDICLMNRKNIIEFINEFRKNLNELSGHLKRQDANAIHKLFKKAKALRENVK